MKNKLQAFINRFVAWCKNAVHFFKIGIWHSGKEESKVRQFFYNIVKSFIMAGRRYSEDRLQSKASALTYNTLLAIVPMLAVLFGIARGFGFQNIVKSQLFAFLPGQQKALNQSLTFVDSYLEHAQSGVFVGIGLGLLIWTVMNLLGNIEDIFNQIWRVQKSRSLFRKVTDYLSLFLVLPLLMICSGGISVFLTTTFAETLQIFNPAWGVFLKLLPFVIIVFTFTGIYMFIPNTHVKFLNAFGAGLFAGIAFQLFQLLYISGQLWVSKYNAIYGSFAALPLLLLWLQLSWVICLLGVELAAAGQNIEGYNFEKDIRNISRRCKEFFTVLIAALIVKRFEKGEKPYTKHDISLYYKIPIKLTTDILISLTDANVILEAHSEQEFEPAYVPAMDISKLTIASLLDKIDQVGSEDFNIDHGIMKKHWEKYISIKNAVRNEKYNILLKDI
ncbi:MAG: YihY/virulence factor BrkB family protein [Candidatus Azobacteroides sp.]|nr:YihY/virulence factor BrkB family protein [Candidatus Azobacteroides sp.]